MDQLQGYASSEDSRNQDTGTSSDAFTNDGCSKRQKIESSEVTEHTAWLPSPEDLLSGADRSALDKLRRKTVWRDRHQGRARSFPHVEGMFSTAVYIEVPTPLEQRPILSACLHRLKMQFPGLRPINVVDYDQADMVQSAYHLSLSRTVSVRYNQILPLVHSLRERLKACQRFSVSYGPLTTFTNDERSRTFLSLLVADGKCEVCSRISEVNMAFSGYQLPSFYKDPMPHVSVAWSLGDVANSLHAAIGEQVNDRGGSAYKVNDIIRQWHQEVNCITCRVGKKTYDVWPNPP